LSDDTRAMLGGGLFKTHRTGQSVFGQSLVYYWIPLKNRQGRLSLASDRSPRVAVNSGVVLFLLLSPGTTGALFASAPCDVGGGIFPSLAELFFRSTPTCALVCSQPVLPPLSLSSPLFLISIPVGCVQTHQAHVVGFFSSVCKPFCPCPRRARSRVFPPLPCSYRQQLANLFFNPLGRVALSRLLPDVLRVPLSRRRAWVNEDFLCRSFVMNIDQVASVSPGYLAPCV